MVEGSSRPGYPLRRVSREEVERWSKAWLAGGFEGVVCLLSPGEIDEYYAGDLLGLYRRYFPKVYHFPVEDYSLPSPETLAKILLTLERETASGIRLVVHCSAGVGRTGLVLAAWDMFLEGLSLEEAVILQLRQGRNPLEAVLAGRVSLKEFEDLMFRTIEHTGTRIRR